MSAQPELYRIRKYPNRRFYDTTRSRHVTQDELFELVRQGHSIQVTDSNTGEDISNIVLTQMILERDPPKLGLFPAGLLHQVIQANQQMLQSFVERYFNRALESFLQSQNQFEEFLRRAGVPDPGLASPLQWARSFMGGAMGGAGPMATPGAAPRPPEPPPPATPDGPADSIADLRQQLADMSSQLAELRAQQSDARGGSARSRGERKGAKRRATR